ncbi:MAG: PDZ domain-containing protein [Planctomycetes bacterium]|nr:PDZ domain-containing protein [Planctomycetota bacterium]
MKALWPKLALVLVLVATSFAAASSLSVNASAQQLEQGTETPWTIITISGEPRLVLLFNSHTAETYALEEKGSHLVWRLIEVDKQPHNSSTDPVTTLFFAIAEAWEVAKDSSGKVIGVRLTDRYQDPGVGLQVGDTITHINETPVGDPTDVSSWIRKAIRNAEEITIKVMRNGKESRLPFVAAKKK